MNHLITGRVGSGLLAMLLIGALLAACGPRGADGTAVPVVPENTPASTAANIQPSAQPQDYPAPQATIDPNQSYPAPQITADGSGYPAPQPSAAASVSTFPDPALYEWRKLAEGMDRPTDLADPGNGALWVLSQGGVIYQVRGADVSAVMDISSQVGSSENEQGLLGIALDPSFDQNRFFYVNYTDRSGNTVIARFTAAADLNSADPQSEERLIQVDQPYANHNGGGLAFGPDGLLYIGLGDGGSGGDPQNNAQSVDTLLGKLLRIDVSEGQGYAVPETNPYARGGGKQEIYALGLRNPWRFSFDRATGDLYIADVGQNLYEEVNFEPAGSSPGANYGWRLREGEHPYEGASSEGLSLVDPVWEYDHAEGCSITGGYVYRGSALPEFNGIYLVGDYCNGSIWGLLRGADGSWNAQKLWTEMGNLTSFGQDRAGEVYFFNRYNGGLYQLVRR